MEKEADLRARIEDRSAAGDFLECYELAQLALAESPDDLWLHHQGILALARAGATAQARARYDTLLANHPELLEAAERDIRRDFLALNPRLLKDVAFAAPIPNKDMLAQSAKLYAKIYHSGGNHYTGINAATLFRLCDKEEEAEELAHAVLNDCGAIALKQKSYYDFASEAEAYLVLGNLAQAKSALCSAVIATDAEFAKRATSYRQLARLCSYQGYNVDEVLAPLRNGTVIHYCGHLIAPKGESGRFPAEHEEEIRLKIEAKMDEISVASGFGALACGADILFAEALKKRGAALHVILPFETSHFIERSVQMAGPTWPRRFFRCLHYAEASGSVSYAGDSSFPDEDTLFAYGSQLAMGLARLHAARLESPVQQLAVYDGRGAGGRAGTAVDIAHWRALGLQTETINCRSNKTTPNVVDNAPVSRDNRVRAMLFGDIKGFSKLDDGELLIFISTVMGRIAEVLGDCSPAPVFANSWGDGIFVIFDDLADAAECGLKMQAAISELDLSKHGLPEHLGLRLGGHVGPTMKLHDDILGRDNFFGAHVSRAARIEPVTPVGQFYVTETFAASLMMQASDRFHCEYAGNLPAAKDYGNLAMYAVHRS